MRKIAGHTECSAKPTAVSEREAQLVMAEKRTSLATMRTGIALFALPLSLLGLLIAASKYVDLSHALDLILPSAVLLALLIGLGSYLIVRSLLQIKRYDRLIGRLKGHHGRIAEFLHEGGI